MGGDPSGGRSLGSMDPQTLIRAFRIAAALVDAGGVVVAWNRAAEQFFGRLAHRAVGRRLEELELGAWLAGHLNVPESSAGEPARREDVSFVRADPQRGASVITRTAVVDDAGRTLGLLICIEELRADSLRPVEIENALLRQQLDATSEKAVRAEEEREIAEEELRSTIQQLGERVEELEQAAVAARHKDRFLAVLAHELRSPLAPIVTAAHVLRRQAKGDPAIERAIEIIQRQAAQQARLLDDLLDLSRISHGKIDLRRETVDLRAVVQQALDTVRETMAMKGQTVSTSIPDEPIVVDGDSARLVQVVTNLLTNTTKFTPTGGQIWVEVVREGSKAIVTVRDNGVGIAADRLTTIFDLFSQTEPSQHESGGLGLGLALVKSFVELHGGWVSAASEGPGKGSAFVVVLPLRSEGGRVSVLPSATSAADPVSAESAVSAGGAVNPREPLTILVIEDDADSRDLLRVVLEADGHRVEAFDSGVPGLDVARKLEPRVALIDLGLPDIDGLEVARRLRAELGRWVTIIALTGYAPPEGFDASAAGVFDDYLVKPVDPGHIARAITGARARHR